MLLEMLCTIPENVGWAIAGVMAVITAQMGLVIGKLIYRRIRKETQERRAMIESASMPNTPDGEFR